MRVYGIDGCPAGWTVCAVNAQGPPDPEFFFAASIAPLLGTVLAIDIPIGLPDAIAGPGRSAEQAVRRVLGPRSPSVFSIPSRRAVYAPDYASACAIARQTSDPPKALSRQAFQILPKVRELDAALTPENQHCVFECHAEIAFWRLNGERAMAAGKRQRGVSLQEGLAERLAVLEAHGIMNDVVHARPGMPLLDVVDAAAIALIARRCAAGTARPFPDPPDVDARGLRIAIWA